MSGNRFLFIWSRFARRPIADALDARTLTLVQRGVYRYGLSKNYPVAGKRRGKRQPAMLESRFKQRIAA